MSEWDRIRNVLFDSNTFEAIYTQLGQHVFLSFIAALAAVLVAVPLGIYLTRTPRISEPVMNVVGMFQTLPSVALLALMIPLLGIGVLPALAALFLYGLLPILRNTYTGIRNVDPALIEAAYGMGMTPFQVLYRVQLPLASRVIMSGIRVSTVLIIGWATLAAYVGAGGLGDLILTGFSTVSSGHIIAGGLPVTVLAIVTDTALGRLEWRLTPQGVRE